MNISGLIPRNFAELAEAVPIDLNPYKPSNLFVGLKQTVQTPLFAYKMFYSSLNENETYHPITLNRYRLAKLIKTEIPFDLNRLRHFNRYPQSLLI